MGYRSWERWLKLGPHGWEVISPLKADRMENDIGSMRGSWEGKKIQLELDLDLQKTAREAFQDEQRWNKELCTTKGTGDPGRLFKQGARVWMSTQEGPMGSCCWSARGRVGVWQTASSVCEDEKNTERKTSARTKFTHSGGQCVSR